jgi:hypothetical protein
MKLFEGHIFSVQISSEEVDLDFAPITHGIEPSFKFPEEGIKLHLGSDKHFLGSTLCLVPRRKPAELLE